MPRERRLSRELRDGTRTIERVEGDVIYVRLSVRDDCVERPLIFTHDAVP